MHTYKRVQPSVKSERIPVARSGHRIVCDSGNLYSFGGYNPVSSSYGGNDDEISQLAFPLFQELWKFNFATQKWSRYKARQTIPVELASNAVVLLGNLLVVHGGTGSPFGVKCSNKLYTCNVADAMGLMSMMKTSGQAPPPQYGQSLVYHDGYLYSIGGTTGYDYTCDIHRLNFKEHRWEAIYMHQGTGEYEPEGRYRHECAFYKNNIFILGGGTATEVYDLTEIPTFNLDKRKWTKTLTHPDPYTDKEVAPGIPNPRKCHGCVQIETPTGPRVYISGGYDGERVFNDLWCLDLQTFQWYHIWPCLLPYPTYFHAAAVTPQGKMYLFGGICQNDEYNRTNSVYSTWLCIPKLSEMCWEAILHYNPKITEWSQSKLLEIGIPKNYVQRIE